MSDKKTKKEECIKLILKPGEQSRLLKGHRWIFSNELKDVPRDVEPGSLATVQTNSGRVLGVGFFNPKSLISFRLLSREQVRIDAKFFRGRFEEALRMRERHVPGERSFRLCFGESDGLPGLVVDKYGDILVLQSTAAGIDRRLELIVGALAESIGPKGIYAKNVHPSRVLEGLAMSERVICGEVPDTLRLDEGECRFAVKPSQGFSFDQRENRAALAPYMRGRVVLDPFCRGGAWSVTAAKQGAARVLGLDSSRSALQLARESAELSGVDPKLCEFDEGEALEVLTAFAQTRQKVRPDLIVLTPPNHVCSKKHLAKGVRGYARLNALALRILRRGGLLATSTDSHHVSREEFVRMLRAAAAKLGKVVHILELRGAAKDHPLLLSMPETEYLQFALIEVA